MFIFCTELKTIDIKIDEELSKKILLSIHSIVGLTLLKILECTLGTLLHSTNNL